MPAHGISTALVWPLLGASARMRSQCRRGAFVATPLSLSPASLIFNIGMSPNTNAGRCVFGVFPWECLHDYLIFKLVNMGIRFLALLAFKQHFLPAGHKMRKNFGDAHVTLLLLVISSVSLSNLLENDTGCYQSDKPNFVL